MASMLPPTGTPAPWLSTFHSIAECLHSPVVNEPWNVTFVDVATMFGVDPSDDVTDVAEAVPAKAIRAAAATVSSPSCLRYLMVFSLD
jgi:hypothetical protein